LNLLLSRLVKSGENYARVREYEKFLERNNVAHIIPSLNY
jgi:hypothetical protein